MKIVAIGGSGLIGSELVPKLREHGHEVVAASPKSGVNCLTGEGLADAMKGASVVVDVSNAPSWEDPAVSTRCRIPTCTRLVALKFLSGELAHDPAALERFRA